MGHYTIYFIINYNFLESLTRCLPDCKHGGIPEVAFYAPNDGLGKVVLLLVGRVLYNAVEGKQHFIITRYQLVLELKEGC